jgi:ParB-like chromosome segregation protein Spo0J
MQLIHLPVGLILPNAENPAHRSVPDPLLVQDIKKRGILEPLLVGNGPPHPLFDGHRRLAAAKLAGIEKVPCLVIGDVSAEEIRLVTAVHKKDLSSPEKVHAFFALKLLYPDGTAKDLAARLSIDPSLASIYGSYEHCIPDVQVAFDAGQLTLKAMYAISKQELGEQRELLEMSLSCSGEEIVRKARNRVNGSNGVKVSRMKIALASGVAVTLSANGLTLDAAIDAAAEAHRVLEKGRKDGLTAKTIQKVSADRAAKGGG